MQEGLKGTYGRTARPTHSRNVLLPPLTNRGVNSKGDATVGWPVASPSGSGEDPRCPVYRNRRLLFTQALTGSLSAATGQLAVRLCSPGVMRRLGGLEMQGSENRRSRTISTSADREARLAWLLDRALSYVNSVELKLTTIGAMSPSMPRTAPELTWRLLLAQTIEQTRSLERAIDLLSHSREDVVDLQR